LYKFFSYSPQERAADSFGLRRDVSTSRNFFKAAPSNSPKGGDWQTHKAGLLKDQNV